MTVRDLIRFTAKYVIDANGCWCWTAAKSRPGYGYFYFDGHLRLAHRIAYEHWTGPIPDGKEIDHVCRNRSCVNPAHLEAISHLANIRRSDVIPARARAHMKDVHAARRQNPRCRKGHLFGENRRRCMVCYRISQRRWRELNGRKKVA